MIIFNVEEWKIREQRGKTWEAMGRSMSGLMALILKEETARSRLQKGGKTESHQILYLSTFF